MTWIPEDGYLQVDSFNIRRGTRRALEELLTLLERHYSGYTAHFGFPGENRDAICFLRSRGFRCIEHAWNHTFVFQNYRATADAEGIERITRQSFDRFCAVYRPDPDTYWDCGRIFETLEDWTIFVKDQNGAPDSAIFLRGGGRTLLRGLRGGVCGRGIPRALVLRTAVRRPQRMQTHGRAVHDIPLRRRKKGPARIRIPIHRRIRFVRKIPLMGRVERTLRTTVRAHRRGRSPHGADVRTGQRVRIMEKEAYGRADGTAWIRRRESIKIHSIWSNH